MAFQAYTPVGVANACEGALRDLMLLARLVSLSAILYLTTVSQTDVSVNRDRICTFTDI